MSHAPLARHRTARVPNEPFRAAGLTIPQLLAMVAAFVVGGAIWWALGLAPVGGVGFFFVRSIGAGVIIGLLGLLAYATFDARREPFVRQTLGYPFRRHMYRRQETQHGPTIVAFPTRAPAALTVARRPSATGRAGKALARIAGTIRLRGRVRGGARRR